MSRGRRTVFVAAYGLVTFLAFPHPIGGRVLDLGFVLCWAGPALLALATAGLPPRRAARLGFVAGLVAHTAVLHWIYVVTVTYGHAHPVVGVLAPLGLASYLAVFPAAFGAGAAWLRVRGLGGPALLAVLWTALDHGRSFFLTGFPWATIGYAQHENPLLLPLVAYTGVYGLSFVTALGSLAGLEVVRALRAGHAVPRAALVSLAGVAFAHAAGALLAVSDTDPALPTLRVAVLQGNVDQGVKWSRSHAAATFDGYEDLARRAAAQGAEVIVWPETALPGSLLTDAGLRARVLRLVRETRAAHVIGGVGVESEDDALRFYDSAFLLDAEGTLLDRYDKSHLVPFGEYVPLRRILGLLLSAVARGIAPDNVSAGSGPRPVVLPGLLREGATVSAGIPICYELLFPDLVRRFVAAGGAVLFAITNDAWYGRTGAPYQFLAMTAVRSAETRVFTARAANTGVSAIIDHRGRVLRETRIFERDLIVMDVPLRRAPAGGSFYSRHGDVFAAASWLVLGAAALGARRRKIEGRGEA